MREQLQPSHSLKFLSMKIDITLFSSATSFVHFQSSCHELIIIFSHDKYKLKNAIMFEKAAAALRNGILMPCVSL